MYLTFDSSQYAVKPDTTAVVDIHHVEEWERAPEGIGGSYRQWDVPTDHFRLINERSHSPLLTTRLSATNLLLLKSVYR